MKTKRYLVWSKKNIDLSDPFLRKWYIKQVLTNGLSEDIAELDWEEVRKVLSNIVLPKYIFKLWKDYFESRN